MKRIKTALTAAALAAALLLSPFHSRDAAKLIPVQTLCICADGGEYRVQSDADLFGRGTDPARTFADLERTAPGRPTFSTARQSVVAENAMHRLPELVFLDFLHPGTEVYRSADPVDAEDVTDFLNRHASGVSVSRLRSAVLAGGPVELPTVEGEEGRYRIRE